MAAALGQLSGPVGAGRRIVEWGILAALAVILLVAFLHKSLQVQAQAEVAAVRTTLAALRTALVLEHIRAKTTPGAVVANLQHNPFVLLQQVPGNYRGQQDLAQALAGAPGWYFDSACGCVGYVAAEALSPSENQSARVLSFRVLRSDGPTQLVAVDRYVLHGQAVD